MGSPRIQFGHCRPGPNGREPYLLQIRGPEYKLVQQLQQELGAWLRKVTGRYGQLLSLPGSEHAIQIRWKEADAATHF